MKKLLISFLLIAIWSHSFAQYEFPSQNYPTGLHPRIWITSERMNALQYSRQNNTPEWQRFIQKTNNTYMNRSNENWTQWESYCEAVPYLALSYLITGDTCYANRAIECALKADTIQPQNERYWIRNNSYLPLGYDWLYNYMTPLQRTQYQRVMIAFADNMWRYANYNGTDLTYTSIDTDRNAIGAATYLLTGCALYGENERAVSLLDRFWWIWNRGIGLAQSSSNTTTAAPLKRWISNALGGVYFTGMAYYMNTDTRGLSNIWTTLRTACGYDINQQEPSFRQFWRNMIRSMIDLTEPNRVKLYDAGDWQDPNIISEQKWYYKFITLIGWEAYNAGDTYWASLSKGYSSLITSWHSDPFNEFFFSLPQLNGISPYTQNLPPIRTSLGVDYLFYRNNWENNANYAVLSGQGGEPADHQSEDTGCFSLMKNGEYLTNTPRGYRDFNDCSFVHNLFSIENGTRNGGPRVRGDFEKKAAIDRHRENNTAPLFGYAVVQGDGQWNLDPQRYTEDSLRDRPVKTYRRHFFISGDYVFVLDRLRAKRAVNTSFRLRSLSAVPQVNGNLIIQPGATNNTRLFTKTLSPRNCSYELVNEKNSWVNYYHYEIDTTERKWHYLIRPIAADSINMLNVMQMANGTQNSMDPINEISTSQNIGAQIGDWAVVFSTQEKLRDSVEFDLPVVSNTIHTLVADLKLGNYSVYQNNQYLCDVIVRDSDNTAYFNIDALTGVQTIKIIPQQINTNLFQNALYEIELIVCPNPANDVAMVSLVTKKRSNVSLSIYDNSGRFIRSVYKGVIDPNDPKKLSLNTSNLKNGLYLVCLQADKKSKSVQLRVFH